MTIKLKDTKLNILIAYPYFSNSCRKELVETFHPDDYRLIVDSGAFSAYNSGMEITLPQYSDFIRSLQQDIPKFDFVQLDVVFNEAATIENYHRMMDAGFDPCPVYTRGSKKEYWHELLESKKYIFVGGVQGGEGARNFAKWILENSDPTKDRVHLLAFVKPDFVNKYKPYSVDASSWTSAGRFGNILYYSGGRIKTIGRKEFQNHPPQKFIEACKAVGIGENIIRKLRFKESWIGSPNYEHCENPDLPTKKLHSFISTVHYVYYTMMVQNYVGTRVYFAVGGAADLRIVKQAYQFLKDRKII